MKKKFTGYYKFSESDFQSLWNNCLFVFDTNVLLDFYRIPKDSRDTLLNIFDMLKERIWIPHQVSLEYHNKVVEEIALQEHTYDEIRTSLNTKFGEIEKDLNKFKRHANIEVSSINDEIRRAFDTVNQRLDKLRKEHPDLLDIQERIAEMFENKVGEEYGDKQLQEKYSIGKLRFENDTPPGYKDKKKNTKKYYNGRLYEDKYGDLIVWFQILDKAKINNINVIFVTGDGKEDWWKKFKGKTLGPHPLLLQEFVNVVGSEALFYMYETDQFIKYANKYLGLHQNKQSIDLAIKDITKLKEERNFQLKPKRVYQGDSVKVEERFGELREYLEATINYKVLIGLTEVELGREEKSFTLLNYDLDFVEGELTLQLERKGDIYPITFYDIIDINFSKLENCLKVWVYMKENTWRFYLYYDPVKLLPRIYY